MVCASRLAIVDCRTIFGSFVAAHFLELLPWRYDSIRYLGAQEKSRRADPFPLKDIQWVV